MFLLFGVSDNPKLLVLSNRVGIASDSGSWRVRLMRCEKSEVISSTNLVVASARREFAHAVQLSRLCVLPGR